MLANAENKTCISTFFSRFSHSFLSFVIPFFKIITIPASLCFCFIYFFFQCHLSAIYGQEEHQMAFYGYILVTKNTCVNQ